MTASTEVDKTGASYYGEQTLHYLAVNGETAVVQLGKNWVRSVFDTLKNVGNEERNRTGLVLTHVSSCWFGNSEERAHLRRGVEPELQRVLRGVRLHARQSHRLQPKV